MVPGLPSEECVLIASSVVVPEAEEGLKRYTADKFKWFLKGQENDDSSVLSLEENGVLKTQTWKWA